MFRIFDIPKFKFEPKEHNGGFSLAYKTQKTRFNSKNNNRNLTLFYTENIYEEFDFEVKITKNKMADPLQLTKIAFDQKGINSCNIVIDF